MIFDTDIYFKDKNNEQILFEAYSGSLLYGTNTPGKSDIDIKGVFLPNITDLILNKAPKHYTSSTGEKWEKNTENDVDKTYYSLHYFLELAAKGDTNALDILFAYTNENAVLITSKIWQEIINNINKILTKNVKAYLGYCKSQCIKYFNYIINKNIIEIWNVLLWQVNYQRTNYIKELKQLN